MYLPFALVYLYLTFLSHNYLQNVVCKKEKNMKSYSNVTRKGLFSNSLSLSVERTQRNDEMFTRLNEMLPIKHVNSNFESAFNRSLGRAFVKVKRSGIEPRSLTSRFDLRMSRRTCLNQ